MNLHDEARRLNSDLADRRPDLEWRVVNGSLVLGTSKAWSDWRREEERKRLEEERRRFNWRQSHPVTEQDSAA
jgi:hypothetical protein